MELGVGEVAQPVAFGTPQKVAEQHWGVRLLQIFVIEVACTRLAEILDLAPKDLRLRPRVVAKPRGQKV